MTKSNRVKYTCSCCGTKSSMILPPKDGSYYGVCGKCGYEFPFYIKGGQYFEGEDPEERKRLKNMSLEELRAEINRKSGKS